ncbi:putative nwd2 protein [Mycena sanguinolenta]|uniref:Putative nwd2 protein n=1 Tax=Mycena sanguinolenta TaxID=230812 RepID=A0A8H7DEY1_9AGAR|nr:putative nwd2 protein [Mycena sanguinolenta]
MNNYHYYVAGGTGGAGGPGYGNGAGGAGGQGIGPSLNFDIQSSASFTVNNTESLEAIHDSTDSFMEPKCHPETRTRMLKDLRKWALDPHPTTTILWLYGPAGAGKSAIMRTLATQLHEDRRLGGCFFFKRGHVMRTNARMLFTTIAYQLALNIESLRTPISRVAEKNPSIIGRSIETQMQQLISEPCRAHENRHSLVIVIDGLDECDGHAFQGEILRAILNPSSNHAIFLRFIIASRPEPQISKMFPLPDHSCNYRRFNVEQSFDDVHKYLRDEFSRIHRDHSTMAKIPSPWPEPSVLEKLVRKSSGYFIYASTIIKFIGDENFRPTVRLEVVQNTNGPGSELAYDALDQLYMTILCSVPRQSELIPILCAIFKFGWCSKELDKVFRLAKGEALLLLRGLHSVLKIRSSKDEISSHHASFVDFLKHPDRSGTFCIDILNNQISLARSLLQYYAGPFQRPKIFTLSNLIDLIVPLPPSDEVTGLFPLLRSMNPDYIFDPGENLISPKIGSIASWLKNTLSAPADLIQLWKDYAFMFSIDCMRRYDNITPSVKHIISPSPELLRILVSLGFLGRPLWSLLTKLDLTWTDLRTTLSLQLIRKIVKNHVDTEGGANPSASRDTVFSYKHGLLGRNLEEAYPRSQQALGWDISYLVRLSPPCPVLYRELWSIPPSEIWSSLASGNTLIHHVSKWLESFPDPMIELITFWQRAMPDFEPCFNNTFNPGPKSQEKRWHYHDNNMIVRLHLPNSLKIVV